MTNHPLLSPDEKLNWAISNRLVESVGLKNETFALLAEIYSCSCQRNRRDFLTQAKVAMNPVMEDPERYEFFNLLTWLATHAPSCHLVEEELGPIRARHPDWTAREHPDFNSRSSVRAGSLQTDSPISKSQIEAMSLQDLMAIGDRLVSQRDSFGEPLKSSFLQEIARTATENYPWSEGIAKQALLSSEAQTDIWSALLRGWATTHTPRDWGSLLGILEQLEPLYASLIQELISLLKGAIEEGDGKLPIELLDNCIARMNAVLPAILANEQALPEAADNWLQVAINRPSSDLLGFYFDVLRSFWECRHEEQTRIRFILSNLERLLDCCSPTSEIAGVLVTAKAYLLFEIAQDWYVEHLLPLLASPASSRQCEQCWDGFLMWGSWTQEMLPGLIPAYMHYLPQALKSSDERIGRLCDHLAGIAIFGSVDPIDSGWLDEFLIQSTQRERMHLVGSVTQALGEADDQAKQSAWDRWLRRYIERRSRANPIRLEPSEAGAMCDWALALKEHYAEIVEMLLFSCLPMVKGNLFFYRLEEADLLRGAPVLTARLLTALLSQEDAHDFWELSDVHTMFLQLIDLDPAEPELRKLCEVLGKLNSPRALELESKLR